MGQKKRFAWLKCSMRLVVLMKPSMFSIFFRPSAALQYGVIPAVDFVIDGSCVVWVLFYAFSHQTKNRSRVGARGKSERDCVAKTCAPRQLTKCEIQESTANVLMACTLCVATRAMVVVSSLCMSPAIVDFAKDKEPYNPCSWHVSICLRNSNVINEKMTAMMMIIA